jgi:hypothetical protein
MHTEPHRQGVIPNGVRDLSQNDGSRFLVQCAPSFVGEVLHYVQDDRVLNLPFQEDAVRTGR